LDKDTEPRCSLSRKKNKTHVFDVINRVSDYKTQLDINSVDELQKYIDSVNNSSIPAVSTSMEITEPVEQSKEQTIEKHFMCENDEERDSWIRAIRRARYF
jgi:hypothetical protein